LGYLEPEKFEMRATGGDGKKIRREEDRRRGKFV